MGGQEGGTLIPFILNFNSFYKQTNQIQTILDNTFNFQKSYTPKKCIQKDILLK